jgi:hypothetical protein
VKIKKMKKLEKICLIMVLLLGVNLPALFAQEIQKVPQDKKIYIKLSFESNQDDTGLKNQVKRYIKRDIKRLGNVFPVDEDYKYELAFFVFEPKTVEGERTNIVVLSVIVKEPLEDGRLLYVGDTFKACNREALPMVSEMFKACNREALPMVSEMMVMQLDAELFRREL